jgi:tetratricopeptide (TPR) repeat protein
MTPRAPLLPVLLSLPLLAPVACLAAQDASYLGSATCAECHPAEHDAWRGSHHDLAMAEPAEETVLGDFADAELTAHGVTSRFYRKDDAWYVRTDGPDGELRDYAVRYTFGWYPLQQYLVELPGGRLQALGIAWDSRPVEDGGQRWFHLYPDEEGMDHRDPLHWTSREQNWNYQCAECHSTNLLKGYDLEADAFATTWAEIDVACEACHGPGARHTAQARRVAAGEPGAWDAAKGLNVDLADRDGGTWSIDPETGKPARSVPRASHTQIELCARCHSRRGQLSEDYVPGRPLADTHRLALLQEGLYHADGQILDEVYVYGSFLQSRMFQAGVTCTDCHDAHSLRLKAQGDLVCARCHEAGRYAVASHHHHPEGSAGVSCVGCHMPQRYYMVVDERADHSMRIPRPDLSLRLGTPNACNQCHGDKDAAWAEQVVTDWYGKDRPLPPHYGQALQAARDGAPDAGKRLMDLAVDGAQPAIARATALDLLRAYAEPAHRMALPRLLADPDPLVRAAAARYLEVTDGETLLRLGLPMLKDPVRLARIDAARVLAPLMRLPLPEDARERIAAGLDEYRQAQLSTGERPEAHLNIGLAGAAEGKAAAAQRAYRTALRLDPGFAPAYVNLADLYRALGGEDEAEQVLRDGLARVSDDAALHHALGLLMVRRDRLPEAVGELGRAAELAPGNARYAYVHALAVKETGDVAATLKLLGAALERRPGDRDLLIALSTIHAEAGQRTEALGYARLLAERFPGDADARRLVDQLSDGH